MKLLFVCTGNICRSPTAEGMMRKKLEFHGISHIEVDSAGTHGYHVGEAPDRRSIAAARRRNIALESLRARRVCRQDFYDFDWIFALDNGHLETLELMNPRDAKAQVALLLSHASATRETQVPDPYYGDAQGFEHVLDLLDAACDALVQKLAKPAA